MIIVHSNTKLINPWGDGGFPFTFLYCWLTLMSAQSPTYALSATLQERRSEIALLSWIYSEFFKLPYKNHWYSNIQIAWLSESILAEKQFSSIRILSVIWISFSGTDKICLFITVKLYEGQNFVPCIRSGNKRGTKSWKIDTILYYSFAFNVLIINVI